MQARTLILATTILAVSSAHAQFGGMANPMTMGMMSPAMMMNPMGMMMPMTMMSAPIGMGMMNPMSGVGSSFGGGYGSYGNPQQRLGNPYLNPMGMANPYVPQLAAPNFFSTGLFPVASQQPAAQSYGKPAVSNPKQPSAPAYGYFPGTPSPQPPAQAATSPAPQPAYAYLAIPAATKPQQPVAAAQAAPAPVASTADPMSVWMQMFMPPAPAK